MKNYKNYTRKEIKEVKKNIYFNGINYHGYYHSIKKEISFDETMSAIKKLNDIGINLSNYTEAQQSELIIQEVINQSNYQDFKTRFFNHLI